MTFWDEISKGLSMGVLDEKNTGGVGKGATMRVFAKNRPIGEYEFFSLKKRRKGLDEDFDIESNLLVC